MPQEWGLPKTSAFHYFSKFMEILLFVLKYMYISLLLKMINGFFWPSKIMVSPFKLPITFAFRRLFSRKLTFNNRVIRFDTTNDVWIRNIISQVTRNQNVIETGKKLGFFFFFFGAVYKLGCSHLHTSKRLNSSIREFKALQELILLWVGREPL